MKFSTRTHRIGKGVLANVFGQGVTAGTQLLSLPVFLHFWDLKTYGSWLILSAIPTYFSMSDIGLVAVGMNKMTMLGARAEWKRANEVFQSVLLVLLLMVAVVGSCSGVILGCIHTSVLNSLDQRLALFFLICVALGNLFTGVYDALFRANGNYALGIYLINCGRLVEWAGSIIGLCISPSLLSVAVGALIARAAICVALGVITARRFDRFTWGYRDASLSEIKALLLPGISFMAFPIGYALNIQGLTLLVGHFFGPAFVAVFNAYRTLSRVLVQLLAIVCRSLWIEFSRMYGERDFSSLSVLYKKSMKWGGLICVLAAVLVYLCAPEILLFWTHGKIAFRPNLFLVFLISTLITGIGQFSNVMLLATNRHVEFARIFIFTSVVSVGFSYALSWLYGEIGPAVGILVFELSMAVVSAVLVSKLFHKLQFNSESANLEMKEVPEL